MPKKQHIVIGQKGKIMKDEKRILYKGEVINDTFEIIKFIGEGNFAEVYRVKHKYLGQLALKVLKEDISNEFSLDNLIIEANTLSKLTHQNIIRIFDANKFQKSDKAYYYLSTEFVSGESLNQLLLRKYVLNIDLALTIQKDLCSALKCTHDFDPPIIHRDIKPQNVLLSYNNEIPLTKLGDFGLAKFVDKFSFSTNAAGTLTFMAPEGFWDFYNPSSDVFSAGIVFFQMITGQQPWLYDFSKINIKNTEDIETQIIKARKKAHIKPSDLNEYCDKKLEAIINKSIELQYEKRFKNGHEFLNALLEYEIAKSESNKTIIPNLENSTIRVKERGKGFDQVAGMEELKQTLYNDIILPIEKKELYEKYRISVPNGILLFGPPGCGKTFICQKLAQEVNYNFVSVKPSDIASIYVHGTQEKIAVLFNDARKNAPTILFIDELDAIMPIRDDNLTHSYSQEVNEFLTQLSNCSKDGILLIGTSNRPDKIDPAILRTGRIDKLFYVAPPDLKARSALFRLFLQDRPVENKLSYDEFSKLTEGFISSDIEFISNEASRKALLSNSLINDKVISEIINNTKPSISSESLFVYNKFKDLRNFN